MLVSLKKTSLLIDGSILTFIALVATLLWSMAKPHVSYDLARPIEWTYQYDVDDELNSRRAASIVTYGYKNNPDLPSTIQQLNLLISSVTYHFSPAAPTLEKRMLYTLRMQSLISYLIVMFLMFGLFRQLYGPALSFGLWLLWFTCNGCNNIFLKAKEDSLCLMFVILALMALISFIKKQKRWKIYLVAVLIGLGAATKQYPLLLMYLYFPLALHFNKTDLKSALVKKEVFKSVFFEIARLTLITLFVFILVNPHYYVGIASMKEIAKHYFLEQMTDGGTLDHEAVSVARVIWVVFVKHLWEFWLGSLFALSLIRVFDQKTESARQSKVWSFFVRYAAWIVSFTVIYYGLSLYKQNQYGSTKYFLVGELICFLFAGALFERILLISKSQIRYFACAGLVLIYLFRVSDGVTGLGNTMGQIDNDFVAAAYSTSDLLVDYLAETGVQKTTPVVADFYTFFPADYNVSTHWGVSFDIIQERKASVVVLNDFGKRWYHDDPKKIYSHLEEPGQCLVLKHTINPTTQSISGLGFIDHYRHLKTVIETLKSSRNAFGADGYSFWIYDSTACLKTEKEKSQ